MGNWYQEANKSENEHIKKLIQDYNAEDPKSAKRIEIKNAILVLMGFEDLTPTKVEEEEEIAAPVPYTESDVEKASSKEDLQIICKKCNEEAERLEKTRLLHETFREKIALDRAIWRIKRVMFIARRKLYDQKIKEKKEHEKIEKKVNKVSMKQARFINLYRRGFSFTNITLQEDGIRKEELPQIIEDTNVIKACCEVHKDFVERWQRWKAKFIEKENNE